MTLYFEDEGLLEFPINCKEIAQQVIEEAIDYCQCPYECEVNLLLTMNEEIKELNFHYREINHATDVLSFPMIDYNMPGDFSNIEHMSDCFHPESGELMLGDIVISKEKVIEQAAEYGHSLKREFSFLIAHSMLHLFGYDHMEDIQRREMELKQKEILSKLNILRD